MLITLAIALAQLTGPRIVKKMNAAVRAGSPIKGTLVTNGPRGQNVSADFKLMYPRLYRTKTSFGSVTTEDYYTDKGVYSYFVETNSYMHQSSVPNMGIENMGLYGMDSIFGDKQNFKVADKVTTTTFQGKKAYVLTITQSPSISDIVARGDTLFVDAKTFLPLGFDEDDPDAGGVDHSIYQNLKIQAHLTKKDFVFVPPKGAKLVKMPKG